MPNSDHVKLMRGKIIDYGISEELIDNALMIDPATSWGMRRAH